MSHGKHGIFVLLAHLCCKIYLRTFGAFLSQKRFLRSVTEMDFDDPQTINDSRVFDDVKVHIAFDNPNAFCDKSMVSMVLLFKIQRLLTLYI